MPTIAIDPALTMYYEDHCFAEPWGEPEPVLMIHGIAESSQSWFAWVPYLARYYRVLRPDLRGFGRSTIPPAGFKWTNHGLAADLAAFLDKLAIPSVHVVGAKLGGAVAYQFAADYPKRTRTLSVVSGPIRTADADKRGKAVLTKFPDRMRAIGTYGWAAETQRTRLGAGAPEAQIDWWNRFMGSADSRVVIDVTAMAVELDLTNRLSDITSPTLVITTEGSALAEVETTRQGVRLIPNAQLVVIPSDAYHIAAASPDDTARIVLDFIRSQPAR